MAPYQGLFTRGCRIYREKSNKIASFEHHSSCHLKTWIHKDVEFWPNETEDVCYLESNFKERKPLGYSVKAVAIVPEMSRNPLFFNLSLFLEHLNRILFYLFQKSITICLKKYTLGQINFKFHTSHIKMMCSWEKKKNPSGSCNLYCIRNVVPDLGVFILIIV